VHDLERRIGVAASVEQADAGQPDARVLADEAGEDLPAHQRAAGDEAERVERRTLGEPHDFALDMQARLILDHGDMGERAARRDVDGGRSMPLRLSPRADEAFDEGGARVGADLDGEARIDRTRPLAGEAMNNLDRRRPCARRDSRRDPGRRQRERERQHRVVSRKCRRSDRRRKRDAGGRRIGKRRDEETIDQR
jgi:hypothetical protein